MTAVITRTPAGEEIVILPRADYDALMAAVEDRADAETANAVLARIDRGEEDILSQDEVDALLAAPTPLAFWRRRRGLTQAFLAEAAGVHQGYVSEVEAGKKSGDIQLYKRLAEALDLRVDDLI